VPEKQPRGTLNVRVEFNSGPLAGVLRATASVQVVE
jgi:hypothetical protein